MRSVPATIGTGNKRARESVMSANRAGSFAFALIVLMCGAAIPAAFLILGPVGRALAGA